MPSYINRGDDNHKLVGFKLYRSHKIMTIRIIESCNMVIAMAITEV